MIRLSHPTGVLETDVVLPSSKSVSNRMLLLRKMYEPLLVLENLSKANDTVLLNKLLSLDKKELEVQDAGTAFRFLLAYCAITPGEWIIKGTPRLHERPIADLVNALRDFGANIEYVNEGEKPPLKVIGGKLRASQEVMDVSQVNSSQFVSAILMIAPKIDGEFEIKVNPKMSSFAFVKLTISCLRRMGFSVWIRGAYLKVSKTQKFDGEYFKVESDWTSFYYWFSMVHLAKKVNLFFPGIKQSNMHKEKSRLFDVGNSKIEFDQEREGLRIRRDEQGKTDLLSEYNYSQFPDISMTFAVLLSAVGKSSVHLKGLESLKFKECNRERALTIHLAKMGVILSKRDGYWEMNSSQFYLKEDTVFESYDDHRMAMCIAPLALIKPIIIEDETVVNKSYPYFWKDLEKAGFEIEYL